MKYNLYLLLGIVLFLNSSCSSPPKTGNNPEFPYQDFITDTKKLAMKNNDYYYQFEKQVFVKDSVAYFAIFNVRSGLFSIFDTRDFSLVYQKKEIYLDGVLRGWDIHNLDTIYLLHYGKMVQTDTSFHTLKEWEIEPVSTEYGKAYNVGDPLLVMGNRVLLGHYPLVPVTVKESAANYFSKHPIIELALDDPETILNYYGKFPSFHQRNNYYSHTWMTINEADVIISFDEIDSIYVNNRPVASVRSNYVTKNREIDITQNDDYNLGVSTENCNYGPLLYDPYKNLYYRMFRFGIHHKNEDGTLNSSRDAQKSIIVTDANFNVLKEIVLPKEYFIYDSYVTPQGLMIKRENKNDKENIYYDFFNL